MHMRTNTPTRARSPRLLVRTAEFVFDGDEFVRGEGICVDGHAESDR